MSRSPPTLASLQTQIQSCTLPLLIRLAPSESRTYTDTDPYFIHVPLHTYLPSLLPRLLAFFLPSLISPPADFSSGWFAHDGLPLRWHYPITLLHDLFSGQEPFSKTSLPDTSPWELTVHFTSFPSSLLVRLDKEGRVWEDSWVNAVKEADFLRSGTGKGILSLSKADSDRLWGSVKEYNMKTYNAINERLLDGREGRALRHLPIRFYLPAPATPRADENYNEADEGEEQRGDVRILQPLVKPVASSGALNTVGNVLHTILPSLFPSQHTATLAVPVMHGAVLPLGAPVEEVYRVGAGLDGWVGVVIRML